MFFLTLPAGPEQVFTRVANMPKDRLFAISLRNQPKPIREKQLIRGADPHAG